MKNFAKDFGPFEAIWLNASHQGALPKVAVNALYEAIEWKISPHNLDNSKLFTRVPVFLREALGKLINSPSEDIILGNSASYGLHLLANGITWKKGDEVLLVQGDFPCNILPWLDLRKRGVKVRVILPKQKWLQPEDIAEKISKSTRLLCTSWVFSFSGHKIDLPEVSKICREKNVKFILNCSQALGVQPFDVSNQYADAITGVGFKWLCGPYGTGFCWIDPAFRESLDYNQSYWLAMQTADDLQGSQMIPEVKENIGARKYDIFGTANFFNYVPWTTSINYLLEIGIKQIKQHNKELVNNLIEGLDPERYDGISPKKGMDFSNIRVISHRDQSKNSEIFERLKREGIYISLREGQLRFSPHLYNTIDEIDKALSVLNGF